MCMNKEIEYDFEKIYTIEEIKKSIQDLFSENDEYDVVNKIILFGSYARGDANRLSDLDFVVFDSPKFDKLEHYSLLENIKSIFKKSVDFFTDEEIDENSLFLKKIIEEGKVIYELK